MKILLGIVKTLIYDQDEKNINFSFYFRIAPNLLHRVADIEHLVIVIATVFDVNR